MSNNKNDQQQGGGLIVVALLIVGAIFGKPYFDQWLAEREKDKKADRAVTTTKRIIDRISPRDPETCPIDCPDCPRGECDCDPKWEALEARLQAIEATLKNHRHTRRLRGEELDQGESEPPQDGQAAKPPDEWVLLAWLDLEGCPHCVAFEENEIPDLNDEIAIERQKSSVRTYPAFRLEKNGKLVAGWYGNTKTAEQINAIVDNN